MIKIKHITRQIIFDSIFYKLKPSPFHVQTSDIFYSLQTSKSILKKFYL